jgi:hypothetical protein
LGGDENESAKKKEFPDELEKLPKIAEAKMIREVVGEDWVQIPILMN